MPGAQELGTQHRHTSARVDATCDGRAVTKRRRHNLGHSKSDGTPPWIVTVLIQSPVAIYNPAMAPQRKAKPKGPWTPEEIARNERVARIRVERDRARGVSANLEETVALTRFANRVAKAFKDARLCSKPPLQSGHGS